MTKPDVYEILNRLQTPDAQVLRQAIENLRTECDFERRERFRLDALRSELVARALDAERELAGLREALAAVDHSYQTGSVLPASVLQTLAEHHARILATWPERGRP